MKFCSGCDSGRKKGQKSTREKTHIFYSCIFRLGRILFFKMIDRKCLILNCFSIFIDLNFKLSQLHKIMGFKLFFCFYPFKFSQLQIIMGARGLDNYLITSDNKIQEVKAL